MIRLHLHEAHEAAGASFDQVNGREVVRRYGDLLAEHTALTARVALLDLSLRDRICVVGSDRERLLNGQATNDVKALREGEGCYTAFTNAKGRMEADGFVYRLANEFLVDLEPGFGPPLAERFDRYIVADDVQVLDAGPHYGLLSVQGPLAAQVIRELAPESALPEAGLRFVRLPALGCGEVYLVAHPRIGRAGYDLFVPVAGLEALWRQIAGLVQNHGGRGCGWDALEVARVEAGIPRYGADMDATNLPPEAGIEARAISYTKGCYIGQEVMARLRTYGQVTKALRGLRLPNDLNHLPARGARLLKDGREVGYITTAVRSDACGANIALGYVRRETHQVGAELRVAAAPGDYPATIVPLPFVPT